MIDDIQDSRVFARHDINKTSRKNRTLADVVKDTVKGAGLVTVGAGLAYLDYKIGGFYLQEVREGARNGAPMSALPAMTFFYGAPIGVVAIAAYASITEGIKKIFTGNCFQE